MCPDTGVGCTGDAAASVGSVMFSGGVGDGEGKGTRTLRADSKMVSAEELDNEVKRPA